MSEYDTAPAKPDFERGECRDPAVQEWQQALGASTSPQLRASQAYLAHALDEADALRQERDEALHDLAHARFELDKANTRLTHAKGSQSCAWRELAVDLLRDLRGTGRDGQIYVARGPSGTCVLCGADIARGQAVEAVTGRTEPTFAHACCPTKETS